MTPNVDRNPPSQPVSQSTAPHAFTGVVGTTVDGAAVLPVPALPHVLEVRRRLLLEGALVARDFELGV